MSSIHLPMRVPKKRKEINFGDPSETSSNVWGTLCHKFHFHCMKAGIQLFEVGKWGKGGVV